MELFETGSASAIVLVIVGMGLFAFIADMLRRKPEQQER